MRGRRLFTQTSRQTVAVAQAPGQFISVLRSGRPRNHSTGEPLATFTSVNNHAVVTQASGQLISILRSGRPRNQPLDEPLATFTSFSSHAVVAPTTFVATFRGSRGQQSRINQPISTVTSVNHHAVVAPQILSYYGRDHVCADADQPLSTVTPNPRHGLVVPQAEPHLLTYHGCSGWHSIGLPTTTQTTKERHALVLPNGTDLDLDDPDQLEAAIDSCGFRMLSWQEARLGMAFPESYKMTRNKRNNFFGLGQAITPCVVPWMIERAIEAWG